jgi:hypothetical protein
MNDTDRAILAFEKEHWHYQGNKERVIQERFGVSPNRYYQRLNRLLDEPEALAQQPALVKRLLNRREQRSQRRRVARED